MASIQNITSDVLLDKAEVIAKLEEVLKHQKDKDKKKVEWNKVQRTISKETQKLSETLKKINIKKIIKMCSNGKFEGLLGYCVFNAVNPTVTIVIKHDINPKNLTPELRAAMLANTKLEKFFHNDISERDRVNIKNTIKLLKMSKNTLIPVSAIQAVQHYL